MGLLGICDFGASLRLSFTLGIELLFLQYRKGPAEVARASVSESSWTFPQGRAPGRPRTCWSPRWPSKGFGVPTDDLKEVTGSREVWLSLMRLLSLWLDSTLCGRRRKARRRWRCWANTTRSKNMSGFKQEVFFNYQTVYHFNPKVLLMSSEHFTYYWSR